MINLQKWTKGGSGITNFDPKELSTYERAIRLSGESRLFIITRPMSGNPYTKGLHYYSLHTDEVVPLKDLSRFWEVFRLIEKEGS